MKMPSHRLNVTETNFTLSTRLSLHSSMNENHLLANDKMASSQSELCPLCFCFPLESLSCNEMSAKIEKYLQIKIEYSSSICLNCYNSVEGFHEFYEKIHSAQKNFSEKYLKLTKPESEATFETESNNPTSCNETSEIGLSSSPSQPKSKEVDVLDQIVNNCESVTYEKDKASECSVKALNKTQKLKNSRLNDISTDMEKKMIEFYNIKCEKCEDEKFTSFKMLSKHYTNVHNTQGYIKCCKRNIRVNDKYYLRSHMFKHLQPDTCRCRVCGKELSSLATLKHHMILHKPTEERPFQCTQCDKRFCCKNDLKNHEKAIHLPESEREDYICDVCGKVFQKVANLRYHHSTVHLQEKKFICEICAKCFTTQSGLRTHLNAAHNTLSPIQCQECNKWLKTKDTYQKHLQLHQNNTYPCQHCSKVCNSSASLRSHLVKHSEERPYPCTVCKKSFKTKTHLKNHSTQHIGGSNYKCPYCPKLFLNMSNYYTHRRRMHSGEREISKQKKIEGTRESAYQAPPHLNLNQKECIYDYKIVKNEVESCTNSLMPADISAVRHNIIVSPVSVKFL